MHVCTPHILLKKIAVTWILAMGFAYLLSFFSQIQDLIYWTVLIFISVYFEWLDTENQRYLRGRPHKNAKNTRVFTVSYHSTVSQTKTRLIFLTKLPKSKWDNVDQIQGLKHFAPALANLFAASYIWNCRSVNRIQHLVIEPKFVLVVSAIKRDSWSRNWIIRGNHLPESHQADLLVDRSLTAIRHVV